MSRTQANDAYAYPYAARSLGYTVNGLNQYTTESSTGYATRNLVYDANGNLTGDGTNTFLYDAENRLVLNTTINAAVNYDPLGRMWHTYGPNHGTTRFLYDGDALVAEYDAGGALLRRYIHGDGVDDPRFWFEGTDTSGTSGTGMRGLLTDERGSIVWVLTASGAQVALNRYDEYGNPAAGNAGRFQYTGQAWLPELGLYYYKARMYSPSLGRFMQTDPIGYADGLNIYAYVGNDPVNGTDPTGTQSEEVMDRRNQAILQAMKECEGNGTACAGTLGTAASIPLSAYPIERAFTGVAWLGRTLGIGRAAGFATRTIEGVVVHSGVIGRGALRGDSALLAGANALKNAAIQKGNYGLGSATAKEGSRLGSAWVGNGSRVARDGKTLVSKDGLRTFRPGSQKADGSIQANFERRVQNQDGSWSVIGNGHLRIQ